LNFGHRHPRLVAAAVEQLARLRAFNNDQLGPFCDELARFCGKDACAAHEHRRRGRGECDQRCSQLRLRAQGGAARPSPVLVCERNFHGRTTTIVSFSSDPLARTGFGPYTPDFVSIASGDADALRAAIDEDTVAFLVEPCRARLARSSPAPAT
jgi:ornithine--oxo-acid transaminase